MTARRPPRTRDFVRLVARAVLPAVAATFAVACGGPQIARDGTVVFPEKGARGAAIVTSNGVEFRDREDVPERIVQRDPSEPWRAPIGFILPRSGRFTETSRPTVLTTTGLAVAMRPSDTRVPSWGGEVLVRIDVIAPAAEGTARMGERIALVLDGDGEDMQALTDAALAQLAARDRVMVVDSAGGGLVVPALPASHRSLVSAAVAKRLTAARARPPRDLVRALRIASDFAIAGAGTKRVLVLTDGREHLVPAIHDELAKVSAAGVIVSAVGSSPNADVNGVAAIGIDGGGLVSSDAALEGRVAAVKTAIVAAGRLQFKNVILSFAGTPAPSHVIEASGGDVVWRLDSGELWLGEVHAGEARTEVVRVSVPPWVPSERFTFTVTARYDDVTQVEPEETGTPRVLAAELPCTYDDDIERIANSRHGDVIAYASALATLRRLDAAFVGEGVRREGGLDNLARAHAKSMTLLARDTRDPAIQEQADVLNALLSVTSK